MFKVWKVMAHLQGESWKIKIRILNLGQQKVYTIGIIQMKINQTNPIKLKKVKRLNSILSVFVKKIKCSSEGIDFWSLLNYKFSNYFSL